MIKSVFKLAILLVTLFSVATLSAQNMTPEQVVQKQLETYNDRDIDGFMSVIGPTVTIHDFSTGKITVDGYEACKDFYGKLFTNSPELHSTILNRTVFGNKVIDHERIIGRNGNDDVLELVLVYEVKDGKIIKIWVLKEDG